MQPQDTHTPCRSRKGHWWQPTASPLIFHCGRTGCKAMQHCLNGTWYETQPAQPAQPQASVTPVVVQQADLWT
jgi:hypothetical protein